MNYNTDIKYTFLNRCVKPINTYLIDDDWIKDHNIDMEIILPFKNIDLLDEENLKNQNGIGENGKNKIKWNDTGLEDLLKRNLDKNDFITK